MANIDDQVLSPSIASALEKTFDAHEAAEVFREVRQDVLRSYYWFFGVTFALSTVCLALIVLPILFSSTIGRGAALIWSLSGIGLAAILLTRVSAIKLPIVHQKVVARRPEVLLSAEAFVSALLILATPLLVARYPASLAVPILLIGAGAMLLSSLAKIIAVQTKPVSLALGLGCMVMLSAEIAVMANALLLPR